MEEIKEILDKMDERLAYIENKQKEIYCILVKMSRRVKDIKKIVKGGRNDRFFGNYRGNRGNNLAG